MKKVLRFLTLAAMLCIPWVTQAQADVEIFGAGGTANNQYLPGYNYYNYSYTQQIYTATEIGMAGTINSVSFKNTGTEKTRTYKVYMALTTKSSFTDGNDWVAMSDGDKVFEGSVTFTAAGDWTVITLDDPFAYDGTSNLIISCADVTGSYSNSPHMACLVFDATSQAIRAYRDTPGAYDVSNPGVTGTVLNVKNQIILNITPAGGGSTCQRPTGLAVTLTPGNGTIATLNWNEAGSATNWVLQVATNNTFDAGLQSFNISTNPTKDLTGLIAETQYYARVKADCGGDGESNWSSTCTFTPTAKMLIGSGENTNNNLPASNYYNYSLSEQIYTAAELGAAGDINSIDFYKAAATAMEEDLDVYIVNTNKTAFDGTSDWITVTAGDLVYSGTVDFAANAWTTITLDVPFSYDGTSNIAIVVDNNTGDYSSNTPFRVFSTGSNNQAIYYANDYTDPDPTNPTITGTLSTSKNQIRILKVDPPTCPRPTGLTASNITAHGVTLNWTAGGSESAWQLYVSSSNVAPADDIADNASGMYAATSTTYTIVSGLEDETDYHVWVRANCSGSDGNSTWLGPVNFTTLVACPAPTALTATNITANSATLGWTGSATSYNVRYRRAYVGGASQDFETGDFGDWTTIDADGDSYGWNLGTSPGVAAHAGSYCAYSESYSNDISNALTPDNYLVSPLVALGGTITFYAAAQDNQWSGEHFGVAVSTTSNTDPTAFTTIQEWTMTGTGAPAGAKDQGGWGQYTVNLSAYAGQTGYVAIRHFNCTDFFYLDVDDIVITVPAGLGDPDPWTTVDGHTTNSLAINSLTSETTYEYDVQADCGGEGTSSWAHSTFATAVSCLPVTGLTFDDATSTTADITWTAGASESAWKVYLYDGSDNLIAGYPMDANTPSFTFNGLTANTPYKAGVKAACTPSDLSVEVFTTLRTACGVISSIPYEEGFEAAGIYCWTFNGFTSDNTVGNAHSDNFYIYSNGYDAVAHYAVLPAFSTNISGLMLNFWYRNRFSDSDEGTLYVGYLTNAADYSSFVEVGSIDMSTSSDVYAESYDYVFDGAPAGSRIAFKYVGAGVFNSRVYIDDVTIVDRPTCMRPFDLAVGEVTNHTAALTWDGTSDNYNINYRLAASFDGIEEPFGTAIPSGWLARTGAFDEGTGTATLSGSSSWNYGTNCGVFDQHAYFNMYSAHDYWLITPSVTISDGDALGFDVAYTAYDYYGDNNPPAAGGPHKLYVLISTDDMATWTILRKWDNDGSLYVLDDIAQTGQSENVDLSSYDGETAYIAFLGVSSGTSYDNNIHIDNVTIGTPVAAGAWQNANSATESVTLTGLAPETDYEVRVQGDCGVDGISGWTSIASFTTAIACPAPTALAYAELKSDRVNLSWTSSASDWQVNVYNETNDVEEGTIDVTSSEVSIEGTTVTYLLTGLDPETEYTVKVRNNCEASYAGDGQSAWTSTVNFTTLEACGQPTGVTVTDITNNSASVSWTGDAPTFTVKYRIPAHMDGIEESFGTTIPTGWTNMTGLLEDVMSSSATLTSGSQWSFGNNNGVFDNHARINIYGAASSERKGWLITPAFTLPAGATMSFDLALTAYSGTLVAPATTGTDDRFVVLVYADDAWHILREWNNSGSTYVYNDIPYTATGETVDDIDISAYVGKIVKFAFYGESTVSNADNNLHIDNVVIGKPVDAGAWASLDPTAATNNSITGLTPETGYEVVVVPSCNTSLVSDAVTFTTLAGITKDISANEWYAIASPTHNSGNDMTVAGVANLTSDTYDLMRYNESSGKWESQKADPGLSQAGFTTLEQGRGYIYRRSANATLTFVGQRNTGNVNRSITHSCGDVNIKGFNLVGNPYGVTYAPTNFYTLEPNGMWTVHTTGTVAAGEAFFVYETSNYYYNFTQPSGAKSAPRSNAAAIALTVSNDDYSDVAYARFADGEGMPKMAHLNTEAPALSIPQGDRRYAIANLDENTESFPLHFSGFGEYTFSLSDNSLGLGYLHLIDRETGADNDMLRQSGYTFNANGNESERFVVLLRPTADANSFVRVSDSRLIVDGEGELQVFDVMGRQLGSAQVSGTTTLDRSKLGIVSAGVYVMRLDGNTQKIVVK